MVIVAPVLSRRIAMIVPRMIKKPMDAIVPPKPFFMMVMTSLPGITAKARNNETRKRAMKAFSFQIEVSKITMAMLTMTSIDITTVLMIILFNNYVGS